MKPFDHVSPALLGETIVAVTDRGMTLKFASGRSLEVKDPYAVEVGQ